MYFLWTYVRVFGNICAIFVHLFLLYNIYIYVYNAFYGMKYTFILIICFPQTKCVYINFPHELGWITICILSCIFLQLFTLVIWIICSHWVFYYFICIYLPLYSRVILLMAYRCASATVIDLYIFVSNYVYVWLDYQMYTFMMEGMCDLYLYICSHWYCYVWLFIYIKVYEHISYYSKFECFYEYSLVRTYINVSWPHVNYKYIEVVNRSI